MAQQEIISGVTIGGQATYMYLVRLCFCNLAAMLEITFGLGKIEFTIDIQYDLWRLTGNKCSI